VSGEGGAFAEYDVTRERNVHVLPEDMTAETGALLEPLATAVHAVAQAAIGDGGSILVLGGGPIGLCTALAAREMGAATVIVVEPSAVRRGVAESFGATEALNPFTSDVVAVVKELTDGLGVDAAIDAAAGRGTLDTAMAATRTRGVVVNVAAWEEPIPFNPTSLLFGEVRLTGSLAYTTDDFARAVEIGSRTAALLRTMVTRTVDLGEVVGAFEDLADRPGDQIKVLVRPSGVASNPALE
jgi:(R,R)-butanediol dehydrogenase / meso-butanediol dehydrogenase / diacetyl reductase